MAINDNFLRNSVLAACMLWTGLNAQASVFIADAFATGETPRAVGQPLLATVTPTGSATWVGGVSPVFTASNAVGFNTDATSSNGASFVAFVPLTGAPAGNKIVTVQAEADFKGNDWGSVQFSNVGNDVFKSDLLLSYHQDKTDPTLGHYIIWSNDFAAQLTSGNMTGNAGSNLLKLSYDMESNKASAWINNTQVMNGVTLAYTPVLSYAGFGAYDTNYRTPAATWVDNFQVDVVVVPEPGAISLLVLGGVLACSRFRKTSPRRR